MLREIACVAGHWPAVFVVVDLFAGADTCPPYPTPAWSSTQLLLPSGEAQGDRLGGPGGDAARHGGTAASGFGGCNGQSVTCVTHTKDGDDDNDFSDHVLEVQRSHELAHTHTLSHSHTLSRALTH